MKTIEDALHDYVGDCLALDDAPSDYITLLRLMQRSRNFEDILKTTVTFMKRHGDKLASISDDGIKAVFVERAESQRKTAALLAEIRRKPRAAAKKLSSPKAATEEEAKAAAIAAARGMR
jgi:hypothetical protein